MRDPEALGGRRSNTVWDVNVRVLAVGRHDVEKIT